MHTLRAVDRDRSMDVAVSFHDVPMFRGTAFAIQHIGTHGAAVAVFSAIRTDSVIAEHNKQFGTHLHGQQWQIDQMQHGGNGANPINRTSHCGFADAVVANMLTARGHKCKPGDKLPWWAWGIDLSDRGKSEDLTRFLSVARRLGYRFEQPYSAGTERHHVIQTWSPIHTLERWHVIAKERTA